jgi:hypothetical protein
MPLTTSKPEVIDDIEYPYMGLSMAMMPSWRERDIGAMVAAELTLFRIDEAGKIEIAKHRRQARYAIRFLWRCFRVA